MILDVPSLQASPLCPRSHGLRGPPILPSVALPPATRPVRTSYLLRPPCLRPPLRLRPISDALCPVQDITSDITTTNSVWGGTVVGTAWTSACTVTGRAEFSSGGIKDLICQGNAGLTLNLQGSGVKANNKYTIYVASDVALTAATASKVVEFTAPIVGPGGVNLYFCADGFNVDGSNSKTAVKAKYVVVQDTTSTATTVGATEAVLP